MVSDESVTRIPNGFLLVVRLPDGENEHHLLEDREVTVGRDPSNHIQLSHHFVSQFHAKFVRTSDSLSVMDLGSANKTRVNGREIVHKSLKEGDEIEFASIRCCLVLADNPKAGQPDAGASSPEGQDPDPVRLAPPVSKTYLSIGVILLFSVVVALATQVC